MCPACSLCVSYLLQIGVASGRFSPDDPANPIHLLKADASAVIRAAARQLSDRKVKMKTKIGVYSVLQALVRVLPREVADELGLLVPGGRGGRGRGGGRGRRGRLGVGEWVGGGWLQHPCSQILECPVHTTAALLCEKERQGLGMAAHWSSRLLIGHRCT
jgi:hypothetical protein